MLENIKSPYILNIILFHITEEKKLKLFIYNKVLQNKTNIHLINYKLLSKYIIHKSKNIIKEYFAYNDYIFEGEYKNGKKNGKGKEYYKYSNYTLIYEGEYLDGKRNGKGKEYYFDGKLKFEGEYLKGKKWNGKGYDINGNICYQIENGKGDIKEYNGIGEFLFEGIYINGEKNGKGKENDFINLSIFSFMGPTKGKLERLMENMKENLKMIKEMEKEKNIIIKMY